MELYQPGLYGLRIPLLGNCTDARRIIRLLSKRLCLHYSRNWQGLSLKEQAFLILAKPLKIIGKEGKIDQ